MSWIAESFQFVVFHSPRETHDAFQMWIHLFGVGPGNYQRHPDANLNASQALGQYAGFTWQIQCQPGRVDLFLVGQDDPAQSISGSVFPQIIDRAAALSVLKERVQRLVSDHLQPLRLALVAQHFKNFGELREANVEFCKLTGVNADPTASSDLSFGLNVRREIGPHKIVANRICRWQSLVKQMMQIQINAVVQEQVPVIQQPAVVVNVDINTIAQQIPMKADEATKIAEALFAECDVLTEGGYDQLVG